MEFIPGPQRLDDLTFTEMATFILQSALLNNTSKKRKSCQSSVFGRLKIMRVWCSGHGVEICRISTGHGAESCKYIELTAKKANGAELRKASAV